MAREPDLTDALWTQQQCAAWLGIAPLILSQWCKAGVGPPCVRLTPSRIAYRPADVQAWLGHARQRKASSA